MGWTMDQESDRTAHPPGSPVTPTHGPRLQALMAAAPTATLLVDPDGKVLHANRRALDLVGVTRHEMATLALSNLLTGSDLTRHEATLARMWDVMDSPIRLRFTLISSAGEAIPVILNGTAMESGDGTAQALLYIEDQRTPLAVEAQVERLSRMDPVTGVFNRATITKRLGFALVAAEPSQPVGVAVVDVDRFQAVNDRLGHDVGDAVLETIAARVGAIVGTNQCGRLGADEFMAVLTGLATEQDAQDAAQAIAGVIARPIMVGGNTIHVTATVGVAVEPGTGVSAAMLLRRAVIALHRARETGQGVRVADDASTLELVRQLEVEAEVAEIVRTGRLTVAFQPIMSPAEGIVGVEALLRPIGSSIAPGDLVAVAERTSLILDIGMVVAEKAMAAMAALNRAAGRHLTLSINLSAKQLHDRTTARSVLALADRYGIAPGDLCIELTETAAMAHPDATMQTLDLLHQAGVKLSMDDFGIGYSSFSYLRDLPVDEVKIDMSFLHQAEKDGNALKVIQGIISLCAGMGLETVCEGVEHEQHRRIAVDAGCTRWQGFMASEPRSAADMATVLAADAREQRRSRASAAARVISEGGADAVEPLMADLGLSDLLVLQQVGPSRYAQIGGVGQGRRWAGVVDVEPNDIVASRTRNGDPVVGTSVDPVRVVGPYYARTWVVRSRGDLIVVLGNKDTTVVVDGEDPRLASLLDLAPSIASTDSAAKPLADELGRLQGLRTLLDFSGRDVSTALHHVVATTVGALGCDVGLAVQPGAELVTVGVPRPLVEDAMARRTLEEGLRAVLAMAPRCVQRAGPDDLPVGLMQLLRIRSWYLLPLPEGAMLLAHTDAQAMPRGFSEECQRLGASLATSAGIVLDAARDRAAVDDGQRVDGPSVV